MPSLRRLRKRQVRPFRPIELFDPKKFLANAGIGRTIQKYGPNQVIFSQGKPADAVYYIQEGRVRLSVVSKQGKEATIALLGPGDFFGEGCIASDQPVHMATSTATTACSVLKIEKKLMLSTRFTKNTGSPTFLLLTWLNVTTVLKQTWSINYSTQVKNDWHEPFYCWPDLGKRTSPRK